MFGSELCRFTAAVRQDEDLPAGGSRAGSFDLADWVGGASRTFAPLVEALKKYVLGAEETARDDVPVPC